LFFVFLAFAILALGGRFSSAKLPAQLFIVFFALLAALTELLFFRSLAAATCFHWPSPQLISFGGRALGWRFPSAPPPARLFLLLVWGSFKRAIFLWELC
jgi:hypothetical protein